MAVLLQNDDPFGLFGDISKRSHSTTKRRQNFEESKGVVRTMTLYETQAEPGFRSNSQRQNQGGAREIFHLMTGIPSEKRVQKYRGQDSEVIEEQYARDERDRQLER